MQLHVLAILAVIQGITEFLPISSSGHLILAPYFLGEPDQGLMIDAAVHVGTLAAVMLFFRGETGSLVRGSARLLRGDRTDSEARLVLLLALSTIPVVIAGAAVALTGLDVAFRSMSLIAWTTIIWALVLYAADRWGPTRRGFGEWRLSDAVLMGLAQAISIIPGTSRSGITMTTARALGFDRVDGARLSLLMSIPATIAVGAWTGVKLVRSGDYTVGLDAAIAGGLAFISALIALTFLMRLLRNWSMTPFVIYRLVLGGFLLWLSYT